MISKDQFTRIEAACTVSTATGRHSVNLFTLLLLLNYQYHYQCQYFSIQLEQVTFKLAGLYLVIGQGLVLFPGLASSLGLDLVGSSQPKLSLFS